MASEKDLVIDIEFDNKTPKKRKPKISPNDILIDDHDLITRITKNLIEPAYYNDIQNNIQDRKFWKKTGDIMDAIAKAIAGIGTVLAFAAGFFQYTLLSFLSGCFGTTALVLLHLSAYAYSESINCTMEANKVLDALGLPQLVNIITEQP